MTPQQIDQKVKGYLKRAVEIKELEFSTDVIQLAKLIQEEEHFQEYMGELKKNVMMDNSG